MSEKRILRLRIAGLVQGVGYRAFVESEARRLGVRGWVRNRRDRSVEALIAGAPETVGEMVTACRRGPEGSAVENIDLEAAEEAALGDVGQSFVVLPTV